MLPATFATDGIQQHFFLLYFLPLFFVVYYLAPGRLRNFVILAGSLIFYAWGAPGFVFVILASILLDFILAQRIHATADPRKKKMLLVVSVCINVGILAWFKYTNFLVENVNAVLSAAGFTQLGWTAIALPIGISFFTFHELSYIIDVYRGVKAPMKRLSDYAVYILLFPQLIAGPIIRFHEIADQIRGNHGGAEPNRVFAGFTRFVIGLSRKVLIANVLGEYADQVFDSHLAYLNSYTVWIGALAYTFQIYFDFAGYSDMAIGLALMMGFVFPENFNHPYAAESVTGFWQRWHMSLSRWMKDYLYIPLGGNRVPAAKMYVNLCTVFLLSGLWHGAQWTFVLWGAYHGLFLVLDRVFLLRLTKWIGKPLRIVLTFLIVVVGWIFFRAPDVQSAFFLVERMFVLTPPFFVYPPPFKLYVVMITAALVCAAGAVPALARTAESIYSPQLRPGRAFAIAVLMVVLLFICISDLLGSSFNPFIYFRF